jgi:hypothetical protein
MNEPRAAHSMVLVEDDLVVIGGLGSDCSMLASCERYVVKDDKWELLPSLNVPVMNPSVCVFNKNQLYKFGGKKGEDELANTIERLDLQRGKWEIIQYDTNRIPRLPSSSCSFKVNQNTMLFLGGTFNTYADKCDSIWMLKVTKQGEEVSMLSDSMPISEGFWMQQAVAMNNSGIWGILIIVSLLSAKCYES